MDFLEGIRKLQAEREGYIRKINSLKKEIPRYRGTQGYAQMQKEIKSLEEKAQSITSQLN